MGIKHKDQLQLSSDPDVAERFRQRKRWGNSEQEGTQRERDIKYDKHKKDPSSHLEAQSLTGSQQINGSPSPTTYQELNSD